MFSWWDDKIKLLMPNRLSYIIVLDSSNREHFELDALKERKLNNFHVIDKRIKFYSWINNLLPPKPKSTFRHLKQGIQEFSRKYVFVPADKAANNIVVWRLHYINTHVWQLIYTETGPERHQGLKIEFGRREVSCLWPLQSFSPGVFW